MGAFIQDTAALAWPAVVEASVLIKMLEMAHPARVESPSAGVWICSEQSGIFE